MKRIPTLAFDEQSLVMTVMIARPIEEDSAIIQHKKPNNSPWKTQSKLEAKYGAYTHALPISVTVNLK